MAADVTRPASARPLRPLCPDACFFGPRTPVHKPRSSCALCPEPGVLPLHVRVAEAPDALHDAEGDAGREHRGAAVGEQRQRDPVRGPWCPQEDASPTPQRGSRVRSPAAAGGTAAASQVRIDARHPSDPRRPARYTRSMQTRAAVLALVTLAALDGEASAQVAAAAKPDAPVFVAAWRDDGVLVPFARVDGRVWTPVWPEVLCGDEVDTVKADHLPLSDLPPSWLGCGPAGVPLRWTGVSWKGLEGLAIEPVVRRVDAHCCGTWGLPVQGAPPTQQHGETKGIALSSTQGTRPFAEVDARSPKGRRLTEYLLRVLAEAETSALRGASRSAGDHLRYELERFPPHPEDRERTLTEFSLVEADGGESGTLISFRVQRRYPVSPTATDNRCGAVTVLAGWLSQGRDGPLAVLEKKLDLTDCDQMDVQAHFPFALVERSGAVFVLERRHGYEDESYAVLEVTSKGMKTVFEKNGGGC